MVPVSKIFDNGRSACRDLAFTKDALGSVCGGFLAVVGFYMHYLAHSALDTTTSMPSSLCCCSCSPRVPDVRAVAFQKRNRR